MSTENPYASPEAAATPAAERLELEPPQTVNYRLTEDELVTLTLHIHDNLGTFQEYIKERQKRVMLIAIGFGIVSFLIYLLGEDRWFIVVLFAVIAGSLALAAIRLRNQSRKTSEQMARGFLANENADDLNRKYHATLLEEGFQIADQHGHGFRKWPAVPKLDRAGDMLLVYVSGSSAHAIPSRAFLNEQTFEAFCKLAEKLWRTAQPEANSLPERLSD